jgi:mannose-6-phosphate isomerase class I
MTRRDGRAYEPNPRYAAHGGEVVCGWDAAVATLPNEPIRLAIDGPAILDWAAVVEGVSDALTARGRRSEAHDTRRALVPWRDIVERTASGELRDDPDFATLASAELADLFAAVPAMETPSDGVRIVFGPGAALVEHEVLWYADLPKRHAEAAVAAGTGRNLGQPAGDGPGTTRRLFYIDWPILDRHRNAIAGRLDRWVDVQHPDDPASLDGWTLRRTLAALARRPFRTRPTFNTAAWGGHWGQRELGLGLDAPNTGIGYELIAPESGLLIGAPDAEAEVPFSLAVASFPHEILGTDVGRRFGTSFPIRFDYLDTVDGGNLSVHCHPQAEYMRNVFGWPYTQHESYYVMVGGEGRRVFLGLHDGIDFDEFERSAHAAVERGEPFEIERYVQIWPADAHQLFMIPAGTPHGSGEGNVILEVSATPYLYSLRFYDWLRRDTGGNQRPVHVDHAFANLNRGRRGASVREELVQPARPIRSGEGWTEELIGALDGVFFEVRRAVLEPGASAPDATDGRFCVLNVVEGEGVSVEPAAGEPHRLNYAETLVVPAAVGPFTLRALGAERVRVVKALVRPADEPGPPVD